LTLRCMLTDTFSFSMALGYSHCLLITRNLRSYTNTRTLTASKLSVYLYSCILTASIRNFMTLIANHTASLKALSRSPKASPSNIKACTIALLWEYSASAESNITSYISTPRAFLKTLMASTIHMHTYAVKRQCNAFSTLS
jgi:hypothetical protein